MIQESSMHSQKDRLSWYIFNLIWAACLIPLRYLDELRNIAVNYRLLKTATFKRMKQSPVLLGIQRKHRESDAKSDLDDFDEEDVELQYDLREAKEIVIADEIHAHKAFGDSIFTAPQEDILEGLYISYGCYKSRSYIP